MRQYDRIYADVYLDRIEENMRALQKNLNEGTMMIGVVKADGYGHGAVPVAKTIDRFVAAFAVATVDEALNLRRHGIDKGILVLGIANPRRYEEMVRQDIRPSMFDYEEAAAFSKIAVKLEKKAKIHIAVDTGMSRIGLSPDEAGAKTVERIAALPGIEIEGLFTHFASADEADKRPAGRQLKQFLYLIMLLDKKEIYIPVHHCSNSAGIIELREAHMDAVRAGISIYGLYPSDQVDRGGVVLKPAMELRSFVTCVREIGPGTAVSYGGTFVADRQMRVATVSAGYGDGYPRSLSGRGEILIRGKRAKILGRVCMDQLMADVTEIPEATAWDVATLLGQDGGEEITMEELAGLSGGFHYEIPCVLGKRVPRVYRYHGKQIGSKDYFFDCYEDFMENL